MTLDGFLSSDFSTPQIIAATGATFRQLDYWARARFVEPVVPASGSGTQRRWSLDNACQAAALQRLSEAGTQVNRVAPALSPCPARLREPAVA